MASSASWSNHRKGVTLFIGASPLVAVDSSGVVPAHLMVECHPSKSTLLIDRHDQLCSVGAAWLINLGRGREQLGISFVSMASGDRAPCLRRPSRNIYDCRLGAPETDRQQPRGSLNRPADSGSK